MTRPTTPDSVRSSHRLSIAELGDAYRAGSLRPVDVTRTHLSRIGAMNGELRAFIFAAEESALATAQKRQDELDSGLDRGPLHGVPVAVKDLIDTRAMPTTYGSRMFSNFTPEADATVVRALLEAGAVIVGKTNTDPFAFGVTTENPYYGSAVNPWRRGHSAGGSSGGSAIAVAAGLATVAIGSDTAGSVRIPAACCGLVGIKPTSGTISRAGVFPLSWSLDHVGVLGRTAEDVSTTLAAVAVPDDADPLTIGQGLRPLTEAVDVARIRIGLPSAWFFDRVIEEAVAPVRAVLDLLRAHGATLVDVDVGPTNRYLETFATIGRSEAADAHRRLWHRREEYEHGFRAFLEDGQRVTVERLLAALREREAIAGRLTRCLEDVDFLATPTMPILPPPFETPIVDFDGVEEETHNALMRLMFPFNLSGHPALSVPCGRSAEGLPTGLQLAGRRGDDARLLAMAAYVQDVAPLEPAFPAGFAGDLPNG